MMVEELADPRHPPLLGVVLSRALMIDFLMVKRFTESGGFVVNRSWATWEGFLFGLLLDARVF